MKSSQRIQRKTIQITTVLATSRTARAVAEAYLVTARPTELYPAMVNIKPITHQNITQSVNTCIRAKLVSSKTPSGNSLLPLNYVI